jgi:thioredoxin reductase (NADPH)
MALDLVIAGAGPAGVSAALWARSLDLDVALVEAAAAPGGQLRAIHFEPRNFAMAIPGDGATLVRRLTEQLLSSGVTPRTSAAAKLDPATPAVTLADGETLAASAVLVATGMRRRRLEVPGERTFEGRGVSHSATRDRERFAGQEVLVVGGGNAAFENALLLADAGCSVSLAVRDHIGARDEFRAKVAKRPSIEVLADTHVLEIVGDERVTGVRLEGPRGRFELPVAGVVVKVGALPNTEWVRGILELDDDGYVQIDERFGTSQPRVWAAGDVTRPEVPGLSVAIGQAALAVAIIRATLRQP